MNCKRNCRCIGKSATISDPDGWSYGGFEFSEPIGDGEYEISFDFKNFSATNTSYGVFLKGRNADLSDTSASRRILHRNGNTINAFGKNLYGSWYDNVWYNYNLKLTSVEGGYDAKITIIRSSDSYKSTTTTTIDASALTDMPFTRIVFGYSYAITIDNLVVKIMLLCC